MYIILAMVVSVDGKSIKGNSSDFSWPSKEDQEHLSKLISENNLILMGGNTYEVAKPHMKLSPDKLRVVVTRNPKKFSPEEVEGQLEFVSGSVGEIIDSLEKRGHGQMLLLSGANLNKEFFKENLIDEIYLTVEPKIFGSGNGMVSDVELDINLELMEMTKLNEQGTVLLHYKVLK